MPPKIKKVCPYCGETCEAYYPINLICKCGAKYYCKTGTWLERKKKKNNPDLVEVVRCKDCKYKDSCNQYVLHYGDECELAFCSYGEKKDNERT